MNSGGRSESGVTNKKRRESKSRNSKNGPEIATENKRRKNGTEEKSEGTSPPGGGTRVTSLPAQWDTPTLRGDPTREW
jgi:hypothetical protein